MEAVDVRVDHRHHWVIAEANGPNSAGVCKHCALEREFRNWLPDMDFITNEESRGMAGGGSGWNGRGPGLRARYSAKAAS